MAKHRGGKKGGKKKGKKGYRHYSKARRAAAARRGWAKRRRHGGGKKKGRKSKKSRKGKKSRKSRRQQGGLLYRIHLRNIKRRYPGRDRAAQARLARILAGRASRHAAEAAAKEMAEMSRFA